MCVLTLQSFHLTISDVNIISQVGHFFPPLLLLYFIKLKFILLLFYIIYFNFVVNEIGFSCAYIILLRYIKILTFFYKIKILN